MTEPSSEKLARELDRIGLADLAQRARANEFHDYQSPHGTPEMYLADLLYHKAMDYPGMRLAILSTRERLIAGEFDATKEESDKWAASPEGQEIMRQLMKANKKLR